MIFDYTLVLLIPALLLSLFAQWKVKSTFQKFSEVPSRAGISGAGAAKKLAKRENVPVSIEQGRGFLSDHYNPKNNSLMLSPDVYQGRSISSLGVAAHELGHAIQKKEGYWPMYIRSGLVPVASFGSQLSMLLFFGGLIMGYQELLYAGIVLFSAAVLFTLVTLPVEFDASKRAMNLLQKHSVISGKEVKKVRAVLRAAALTYVAAAIMAVAQLLRLIFLARSTE